MKRALFFDLDGTLWDALVQIKDAWNEAMVDEDEPFRFTIDDIRSHMGLTPEETGPIAFPGVNFEKQMQLFKICFDNEIKYLKVNPGIMYPDEEEVISELAKKYDLYIVSNADVGYIDNYLINYDKKANFKGKLCAGDTHLSKAENIVLLKKEKGIDEVIYIGDTNKDYVESSRAGVKFIHAAYGFGKIEDNVPKINNLKELINEVERLFN